MQFEIRQAQEGDDETLARLLGVLGYPKDPVSVPGSLKAYDSPCSRVWVALCEQGVVGFLSFHAIPLFHEPGMLGRITAMAIDPAFQRQGVGRALVAAAEAFAMGCGCGRMEVTSGDRREQDAHVFYQTLGYESDCRRFLKRLGEAQSRQGEGGAGTLARFFNDAASPPLAGGGQECPRSL